MTKRYKHKVLNPSWAQSAIVYQIYPRSFKDGNGDGIGDLKGIIEKLDYLKGKPESLGINTIWISPFYKSPMCDFGYDVSSYIEVDEIFGNIHDFDTLVKEAHNRDIKVMMDYIPNHTSDKHQWFIESASAKDNPKRNWYIWRDPSPSGGPPNNWINRFGGSAWEYDQKTQQYYLHTFLKEQPDLNWRNQDVVKAMEEVLIFWLDRGVDGFRMDAVFFLIKDEHFRDDPINPDPEPAKLDPYRSLIHTYSSGRPETLKIINNFTKILEKFGDKFMVTELETLNVQELLPWYDASENFLHAPFNFALLSLPWNAQSYSKFINEFDSSLDPKHIATYVLGNHDVSRVATRLGEAQSRIAAMLLLTLKGMPYIYYGDELGMHDGEIPLKKRKDPFGLKNPDSNLGRDPARIPMQWDSSRNAGFSEHEPWLPVGEDYEKRNVEKQQNDPHSMLQLYKILIRLRKQSKAILLSKYLSIEYENVLIYTRQYKDERILVILNFSPHHQVVTLPFQSGFVICNTFLDIDRGLLLSLQDLKLRPNEGYVFLI